jgi:hypothetical protein
MTRLLLREHPFLVIGFIVGVVVGCSIVDSPIAERVLSTLEQVFRNENQSPAKTQAG